ncbi:MAG: PQQ-dependent sugar dehydrogenase [Bacteroidia bacterium]|nr:PQQ-dependent sugar dehydrogenase [Bacteroidia bacterium]
MRYLSLCLLSIGYLSGAYAQSQPEISLSPFVSGLTRPVDIAHAGDSRLFVVEQPGTIRIILPNGTLRAEDFLDIQPRVRDNGSEQGLLGLAFHPQYAQNGYFYVNYTNNQGNTRISRFRVDPGNINLADTASETILLTINQPYENHNGGDLAFGPDGYLYIALGDGGSGGDPQNYGQNPTSFLGKMLRIDVDSGTPYAIPSDNPFVGSSTVAPEIWALGLRNPWRFSFDRATGEMWIADVGQNNYEEIDVAPAGSGGLNYGWRCYEGDATFNLNSCNGTYTPPVFDYQHSFAQGSSVTGGFVYRGSAYPGLVGTYVFGDYNSGNFWLIRPDAGGGYQTVLQGALMGRDQCSSFGEDAAGELYVASHKSGIIYELQGLATGIDDPALPGPLHIYPHPFASEIVIEFPNPNRLPHTLTLTDARGRAVRVMPGITQASVRVERGDLPAGLYVAEIQHETGLRFTGKVIVVP